MTTKLEVQGVSVLASGKHPKPPARFPIARTFRALNPTTGSNLETTFHAATPDEVDAVCRAAWQAYFDLSARSNDQRAAFLDTCATRVSDLGDELVKVAAAETGLGPARLVSERERTVNSLRMFAAMVREGSWVRASIDRGDAARRPLPKPDVRRMLRPVGPVAVFGASNFPLAYSTAGGDTASALAAGCPVIVKGHPSHPGTGELVACAIAQAVVEHGFDPGCFSFLHAGGERETAVGLELVRHACVRAVGFTGSTTGGMTLVREATARPDPIPVFAEMSSVNPVCMLPEALESSAKPIAERLYASVTNASGQMCTCPGLVFAKRSDGLEVFLRAMADSMNQAGPMTMLNRRVRAGFVKRISEITAVDGVDVRGGSPQAGHREEGFDAGSDQGSPVRCSAVVFRTNYGVFRHAHSLHDECFGPSLVVVACDDDDQLLAAAASIQGSLTATIFASGLDLPLSQRLHQVLEQRVGRVVYNGVPTGVEVCTSMVHGGPYPACNQPQSTAVGPTAAERWCRPVCFQSAPQTNIPKELRDDNPLRIVRVVDGKLELPPK